MLGNLTYDFEDMLDAWGVAHNDGPTGSRSMSEVGENLYEGFGLPALEAAACGCPVITSEHSAMAEFVPEQTLFVNPEDVSSISDALKARPSRSEFGSGFDVSTQAAARTWVDVAQETSDVYRAALRG